MGKTTNIHRDIKGFNEQIHTTNALLIKVVPGTTIQVWQKYGWTGANLAAWQGFETQWDTLGFQFLITKKLRTPKIVERS